MHCNVQYFLDKLIKVLNLDDTLKRLESLGNEKSRAQNIRNDGGDNQFGVKLGDLRLLRRSSRLNTNGPFSFGRPATWTPGSLARSGWSFIAERIVKSPEGLDLRALPSPKWVAPCLKCTGQWTLAEIGINISDQRKRAIAIGEKSGVYSDYPVSKGCASLSAPIWINEMVSREG